MVTIRMVGWLANQMNQYAFGRVLALKRNEPLFLNIDTIYYAAKDYDLDVFNIAGEEATNKERPWYLKLWKIEWIDKIWYVLAWFCKKLDPHYIIENPQHPRVYPGMFDYQQVSVDKALNTKWDIYIEGFWHSEKYFKEYEDIIRKDFTLKKPIDDEKNLKVLEKINNSESVSIHVRRWDYAGTHYEGICDMEYYKRAIEYIQSKVTNPVFFVLSDDIDWCKENFKEYKIEEYVENGWKPRAKNLTVKGASKHGADAYKNMILMAACKHNIIANSTFSWRGARLNPNPNKIIVAPKKWHANLDYKDIVPENWVRL